ncbi:CDP-alcohol phosphatidyltransferase family protein [Natronosporangium hydrolyticum]|uniref:CDP-alcohol phosphatidyltransferase family protein n=1 Tax=Natronosporangium hydrolyticum TaxID=2811111 RepID=UPI001EFA11FA|nr:CDP-alcohol phosphatidyltransferase family protein [Natronosporangium hydrolyticum]
MPRLSWRARATSRRRLTADSPRPVGRRRWTGRFRQGGVLARRVLRVSHRRRAGDGRIPDVYPTRPPHPEGDPVVTHPLAEPPRMRNAAPPAAAPPVLVPTAAAPITAETTVAPDPTSAASALLPGERTAARQLSFAVVNGCTLASLSLGLLAILLAMRGDVQTAAICLLACVICDGMDGVLARRLGVSSPFGAQLDSLADMAAFGIAAPVVVYATLAGAVPPAPAALVCAMVAAAAAIRLARFNVSVKDSRYFTGVPTTMAAGVLAVTVLVDLPLPPAVLLLGVAALAIAMVSNFPYATLVRLLRLPVWLWLAPLAGFLADPRLTFVVLIGAYLLSGPLLWVHQRRRLG